MHFERKSDLWHEIFLSQPCPKFVGEPKFSVDLNLESLSIAKKKKIKGLTFLSWTVISFDLTSGWTVHLTNCGSNILSTKTKCYTCHRTLEKSRMFSNSRIRSIISAQTGSTQK